MAASKPIANELEKRLTCTLCLEIFKEPKTISCLHCYCFECIVKLFETCNRTGKQFACPKCEIRIILPDNDLSKLRSSIVNDSLLPLLRAIKGECKKDGNGVPECQSCERPLVLVAFCLQCSGMICEECVRFHKSIRQFREEHQMTMFYDFKQENLDMFVRTQAFCKVKFHEKNRLEYYCQQPSCKLCICKQCALTDHQNHDIIGVDEAAEQAKQGIEEDMKLVKQVEMKYRQDLEQSKRNMAQFEEEINRAKQEVNAAMQYFIQKMQAHRTAMIDALDETLRDLEKSNENSE